MPSKKELPESLRNAIPDKNGNCQVCVFRRRVGNPYPGIRLPEGGKCIRAGGFCQQMITDGNMSNHSMNREA